MIPYTIYLVDDEPSIQKGIIFGLGKIYNVISFSSGEDAISAIIQNPPDLVLLDIGLPGINGLQVLTEIKKLEPDILVIMITAYEDIDTVISAMKSGAQDYITKPIQLDSLKICVKNALDTIKLRKEIQILQERYIRENLPCFIGESNVIQDITQHINKVSKSPDTPILVSGETGTGKELIAKAIHYKSPNFRGPFIALNCASMPNQLVESELFGYEKGAFSSAAELGKIGLVEEASDGTLFLDGVNDLSMDTQAKLLRFLEFGEYYKLGGTKKFKVKTRIISSTNTNLLELIDKDLFRLDLYYRLAVVKIEIPALNERRKDIIPIAKYFLEEFNKKNNKAFTGFSSHAEEYLMNHQWRGNIRELRNLIEGAVLTEDGHQISLHDLSFGGGHEKKRILMKLPSLPPTGLDLNALDKHYISEAFKKAKGNDAEAARMLKMNYYSFRYRRKKLGISVI